MVSVCVSLKLKRSLKLKGSEKSFAQEKMAVSQNPFAPELNEKEIMKLLEDATPDGTKKATKYGMKIFHGKHLKTLFSQFKHPC